MITRHDPERDEHRLEFTRAEIEDLLWRECQFHGYTTRPKFFIYYGGRPDQVGLRVPASEGPQEPSPRLVAELRKSYGETL